MTDLTPREKLILGAIVRNFIDTATPVSSALIAQTMKLGLSPATIRNIMASLEAKGYIHQPHPSAGRVPLTPAYRVYVDSLMKRARLTAEEKERIRRSVQETIFEFSEVMREATRILAHLSHLLGVVVSPRLEQAHFQRMELISLSAERILVIITIQTGLVKTIQLELASQISREKLEMVSQVLNERLHGLRLEKIRKDFLSIVRDLKNDESGLIQLFIQAADRMFDFEDDMDVYYMGTHFIVQQPEFSDLQRFSSVAELLENRHIIVQLLDEPDEGQGQTLKIKIGEEIQEERLKDCSIITAKYRLGEVTGILGIIGPTRMNYGKMVTLVDFTARTISQLLEKN